MRKGRGRHSHSKLRFLCNCLLLTFPNFRECFLSNIVLTFSFHRIVRKTKIPSHTFKLTVGCDACLFDPYVRYAAVRGHPVGTILAILYFHVRLQITRIVSMSCMKIMFLSDKGQQLLILSMRVLRGMTQEDNLERYYHKQTTPTGCRGVEVHVYSSLLVTLRMLHKLEPMKYHQTTAKKKTVTIKIVAQFLPRFLFVFYVFFCSLLKYNYNES